MPGGQGGNSDNNAQLGTPDSGASGQETEIIKSEAKPVTTGKHPNQHTAAAKAKAAAQAAAKKPSSSGAATAKAGGKEANAKDSKSAKSGGPASGKPAQKNQQSGSAKVTHQNGASKDSKSNSVRNFRGKGG